MRIYAVSYHSMTASYGPSHIQANSPEQARRIFAVRGGFSRSEERLITVREIFRVVPAEDFEGGKE